MDTQIHKKTTQTYTDHMNLLWQQTFEQKNCLILFSVRFEAKRRRTHNAVSFACCVVGKPTWRGGDKTHISHCQSRNVWKFQTGTASRSSHTGMFTLNSNATPHLPFPTPEKWFYADSHPRRVTDICKLYEATTFHLQFVRLDALLHQHTEHFYLNH